MSAALPTGAARPLHDHNILVTGAGDGFGRAIAIAAAEAGAQVLLLGRTPAKLEAVYDAIVAADAPAPIIVPGDLALLDEAGAQELADAITEQVGALHGLVHNAALLGPRVPLQFYAPSEFARVLQVNVTAPFLLTRALLPALFEAAAARVLFMSSGVGTRGRAFWGAYAASKFALEGMAQVLREELANTSAVRVQVVNPGRMRTAMRAAAYPGEDPDTLPLPSALAGAIVQLLRTDGPPGQDLRERIDLQG